MRYIDIERQLADIFTQPLDASCFASLRGGGGGGGWCFPPPWLDFRGNLGFPGGGGGSAPINVCHPYGLI
jgi:hypothetical protein